MSCPPNEYAELRPLITPQTPQEVGSHTHTRRESLFETQATSLSRLAMAANLEGLVTVLRDAEPQYLQRAVIEAKIISETCFFRDAEPFEALRTHILPRLIDKRRPERRLRIWSAACSTGQEVYSLALILVSEFPEIADWDIKVIGTDVSERALAYAAKGQYRRGEVDRGVPEQLLQQYFVPQGELFKVCDQVRRLCEFCIADLNQPLPQLPLFDLILLRNVLLYFPPGERSYVFKNMHRHLWQRGFLMLGDAEQAEDSTHLFKPENGFISHFYRPDPLT